jgi:hypothetical protein
LMEFMNKSELRDKVFGTKTADFEEL